MHCLVRQQHWRCAVSVCVRVYLFVCVFIHVCTVFCANTRHSWCVCVCACVCLCVCVCICAVFCANTGDLAECMCMRVFVCIYIYIHDIRMYALSCAQKIFRYPTQHSAILCRTHGTAYVG